MANKNSNPNYIHTCSEVKVDIKVYKKSILHAYLLPIEQITIIDFYLFNAPVLKNGKKENGFNKSLKDYGWGTKENNVSKLERLLLKNSALGGFVCIKSNSLVNTLENMDLQEKICPVHERAVLKIDGKAEIDEAGSFRFTESENRMEALFRHIRNSLAHNRTYVFDNNFVLLEDCDENENITARILVKAETLLQWIRVVKKENV